MLSWLWQRDEAPSDADGENKTMISPDSMAAGLQVLVAGFTSLIEGAVGMVERTASSVFDDSERMGIAFTPAVLHPIVEIHHAFARKTLECWARNSRALVTGLGEI
jgi:hypothetical protein